MPGGSVKVDRLAVVVHSHDPQVQQVARIKEVANKSQRPNC